MRGRCAFPRGFAVRVGLLRMIACGVMLTASVHTRRLEMMMSRSGVMQGGVIVMLDGSVLKFCGHLVSSIS